MFVGFILGSRLCLALDLGHWVSSNPFSKLSSIHVRVIMKLSIASTKDSLICFEKLLLPLCPSSRLTCLSLKRFICLSEFQLSNNMPQKTVFCQFS